MMAVAHLSVGLVMSSLVSTKFLEYTQPVYFLCPYVKLSFICLFKYFWVYIVFSREQQGKSLSVCLSLTRKFSVVFEVVLYFLLYNLSLGYTLKQLYPL